MKLKNYLMNGIIAVVLKWGITENIRVVGGLKHLATVTDKLK